MPWMWSKGNSGALQGKFLAWSQTTVSLVKVQIPLIIEILLSKVPLHVLFLADQRLQRLLREGVLHHRGRRHHPGQGHHLRRRHLQEHSCSRIYIVLHSVSDF